MQSARQGVVLRCFQWWMLGDDRANNDVLDDLQDQAVDKADRRDIRCCGGVRLCP